MIDEVQCGMGRTGKWFAHQWAGIQPRRDAAGQGPGFRRADRRRRRRPEGRHIVPARQPRHHLRRQPAGHACGVETIRIMEQEDGLLANAARVGEHLRCRPECALAAELATAACGSCAARA
jgi:acetylornithine/N-succinyldiaminopimelate aminotransferase